MNTHHHDIDVLLALAAEGADPASAEVANQLAHCAQCLEDLRLQLAVLHAFETAPVPALDDLESQRMRRGLDDELGHQRQVPAPTTSSRASGRRAWTLLAGAAAVTLAVAVGAPMLSSLGGGDDAGDERMALTASDGADKESADDTAELHFSTEMTPMDAADTDADVAVEDDAAILTEESTPPIETPADHGLVGAGELQSLLDLVGGETPSTAREMIGESASADLMATDLVEDDTCAVEGSLLIPGPSESYTLGVFEFEGEPEPVVVTVHLEPSGATTLVAHDPETCGVIQATS